MNFKVYSEEKSQLIAQDALTIFIQEIISNGVLEEFSHGLANIDYKDDLRDEIKFGKAFDNDTDSDYLLFHLVMFGATLLKYNSIDYIMKKKFLGGYTQDNFKAFTFTKGIETGLQDFRDKGKFTTLQSIVGNPGINTSYSYGDTLNKIPFPYFYFEYSKQSLNEIAVDFAKNVAYIRKPQNPNIVIGVFNHKATEIVPIAHNILRHFFVD